jgi:hypothetical protein
MAQVAMRSAEGFSRGIKIAFEQGSGDANASKSYGSFILLAGSADLDFFAGEAAALKPSH